jgi:hypothetical protein
MTQVLLNSIETANDSEHFAFPVHDYGVAI